MKIDTIKFKRQPDYRNEVEKFQLELQGLKGAIISRKIIDKPYGLSDLDSSLCDRIREYVVPVGRFKEITGKSKEGTAYCEIGQIYVEENAGKYVTYYLLGRMLLYFHREAVQDNRVAIENAYLVDINKLNFEGKDITIDEYLAKAYATYTLCPRKFKKKFKHTYSLFVKLNMLKDKGVKFECEYSLLNIYMRLLLNIKGDSEYLNSLTDNQRADACLILSKKFSNEFKASLLKDL